ncbi:hypothetical protein JRQ81_006660 [Phrynocephalus forsythii]|uniref:IQCH-like ATP-grasp domain-containing protein n=1 Tax=Phrynocephalus forsythii TaxID=171643 RepID=A0A9Q0XDM4_9SAUR|nr:hypothetical protein JRQ81_006660 [Phrynocephalus forsythii]
MAEVAGLGAEIGGVLVQVQEDLQQLKEKLQDIVHGWEETGVQTLEAAIEKTESGLKKHTEKYLSAVNRTVLTISQTDDGDLCSRQISKWGIPLETSQKEITFPEKSAVATKPSRSLLQMSSGSKHKLSTMVKILYDPENACHRSVLNENYGVSLPRINRREMAPAPTQRVAKGVTVSNLLVAPPSFHLNKVYTGLPVSERDAEKGILSLIERDLIPRAARITLEKPLVLSIPAPIHRRHRKPATDTVDGQIERKKTEVIPHLYQKPVHILHHMSKENKDGGSFAPPPSCSSVIPTKKSREEIIQEVHKQELATISTCLPKSSEETATELFQNPSLEFDICIHKGMIDHASTDFLGFKQFCCLFWGSVLSFLEQVVKLLKDYAVPFAVINGKKVIEMIPDFELNQRLTKEEVLLVIKNVSAVRKVLSQPRQKYKGERGTDVAATKIQATWRCYRLRKAYIQFRRQQWASGVIVISWLVHVHMRRVRKMLKESRQRHLENFYIRAKHLAANWNRIRTSRRTIIHIPSLGYAPAVREATPDFPIYQGSQIGRLCEIQDSNVDVIYISPFELSEEMQQYYIKLLGLQAALQSGNPKDLADLQDRFKILIPEALRSFPNRPLSLATFLKYSPKTIRRIKHLIQGRDAYIVGGLLNQDDLEVADLLDVPILGPDPEVAHLYSSKSGSKRIFAAACIPVPPGQYDVYSRQQMVEVLSQLIIDYPEVKRWIFKVDNDFQGNGTAYCDITRHLKCYPWILKESHRYGSEMWKKSWAHVWAVDLDLHYSDHLALTRVLLYATKGTLDCRLSCFQVQPIPRKPKAFHPKREQPQAVSDVTF